MACWNSPFPAVLPVVWQMLASNIGVAKSLLLKRKNALFHSDCIQNSFYVEHLQVFQENQTSSHLKSSVFLPVDEISTKC